MMNISALNSALFLATFLVPLALVVLLALTGCVRPGNRHRLRRVIVAVTPLAVVPAIVLAMTAEVSGAGSSEGAATSLSIPWLLLGTHFAVDNVARSMMLIAAVLYGSALSATSWIKMRDAERRGAALCGFLLMAYLGNIGTYLAADAVTFYLSFAVMSFSAAGLVVHYRSDSAHRATRIYLVLSVFSETAILAGLFLTVSSGGLMLADAPSAIAASDHTGLIMTLLLIGFGVKAGTMPLHIWLPLAHPAAPPAASAVLSGAMVKAGIVGWLRFMPSADTAGVPDIGPVETAGWVLLILALLGAFLAVGFGVLQNDPKVILAYSTISQLGFIASVIAVGMIVPELWVGTSAAAVLYAVHHGLAKGALFLGVPVLKHFGTGLAGVVAAVGMFGAALVIVGAPFTSGGLGKYVSKDAVGGISVAMFELQYILPLVATGSTLLLMRFGWVLWRSEREPSRRVDGEFLSWLTLAVAALALPWLIGYFWFDDDAAPIPSWGASTVWNATWPILLGLVLGSMAWWLTAHRMLPPKLSADGTLVAPGDILIPEERVLNYISARTQTGLSHLHAVTTSMVGRWNRASHAVWARIRGGAARMEDQLTPWESSGAAVLVVLCVAIGLLALGWWWR